MRSQTLPSPNSFPNFQHLHAQHTASHSLPLRQSPLHNHHHKASILCTTAAKSASSYKCTTTTTPPSTLGHHQSHSTHNHGCHISANPLTTVVKLSQMDPKHSRRACKSTFNHRNNATHPPHTTTTINMSGPSPYANHHMTTPVRPYTTHDTQLQPHVLTRSNLVEVFLKKKKE
jgi:hypothetical protein